jgi:hypothetical protein
MYSAKQFPICAPCQLKEIDQPISDTRMRKFFAIPQEFYEQSQFLRSIKSQYIRFGSLTTPQRQTFLKVVKEMKHPPKGAKAKAAKAAIAAAAPELTASDDAALREKLVKALDHLLLKDTKAARRNFLELLEDIQAQPITHSGLKHAIETLLRPVRGRPRLLLMTMSELRAVLEGLG